MNMVMYFARLPPAEVRLGPTEDDFCRTVVRAILWVLLESSGAIGNSRIEKSVLSASALSAR